jgi:hypothetical protein
MIAVLIFQIFADRSDFVFVLAESVNLSKQWQISMETLSGRVRFPAFSLQVHAGCDGLVSQEWWRHTTRKKGPI